MSKRWLLLPMLLLAQPALAERAYEPYDAYQVRFYQHLGARCLQRAGPAAQCIELLETSLHFDAAAPRVHLTLGRYYVAAGQMDKAVGAFSRALELDETFLPALLGLGDAWLARGEIAQAEKAYRRYIAQAPEDPLGYYS